MQAHTGNFWNASFIRRKNTWYTIADGNWTNPNIWISNERKKFTFPQSGDDVVINHNVSFSTSSSLVVNNLFINGRLTLSSGTVRTLTCNGFIKCVGSLDISSAAHNLVLNYINNEINSSGFIPGTASTVNYNANFDQDILNLSYANLQTTLPNTFCNSNVVKRMISDLTINGNLIIWAQAGNNPFLVFDISIYNLTVNGSTSFGVNRDSQAVLRKNSPGNILFIGQFITSRAFGTSPFDLSNCNIEFRNGWNDPFGTSGLIYDFKNSLVSFTTNSQIINFPYIRGSNFTIASGITLTINTNTTLDITDSINGLSGTSNLINKGTIYINSGNPTIMSTGTFDFSTFDNTIGYIFSGNQTINYGTFRNLFINKSVSSTLTMNTDINIQGGLTILSTTLSPCILETGTYSLTVNGFTNYTGRDGVFTIQKTVPGNITFLGGFNRNRTRNTFNLTNSNINLEFRGNISDSQNGGGGQFDCGLANVYFTTNSLTITNNVITASKVYIANNITVTINDTTSTLNISQILDGLGSNSTLVNKGKIYFTTQTAAENSLNTGIYNLNGFSNTVGFTGNYNCNINSKFSNIWHLLITGPGFTKTLTADMTCVNVDFDSGSAFNSDTTFELSSYNFTSTGIITFAFIYGLIGMPVIKKNSNVGLVKFTNMLCGYNSQGRVDFSVGNPNVELYGNINYGGGNNSGGRYFLVGGTGTWTVKNSLFMLLGDGRGNDSGITSYINNLVIETGTFSLLGGNNGSLTINNSLTVNTVATFLMGSSNPSLKLYPTTNITNNGTIDTTTNPNIIQFIVNSSFMVPTTLSYRSLGFAVISSNSNIVTLPSSMTNLEGLISYIPGPSNVRVDYSAISNLTISVYSASSGLNLYTNTNNYLKITSSLFIGYPATGFQIAAAATIEFSCTSSFSLGANPTVLNSGTIIYFNNSFNLGNPAWNIFPNVLIGDNDLITVGNITVNGTLNGTNAGSTLRVNASGAFTYNGSSTPMSTGILDTSTNLNTFIYGSGTQSIKGNPTIGLSQSYRNLTLNGGGTKTLQGNVSVKNVYTLTSPATLNTNGYTLTNP